MFKKLMLPGILTALLASPAMAYSTQNVSLQKDSYGYVDVKLYMSICDTYKNVGYSREFGSVSDYDGPYPELGHFSAELDKVSRIGSSNRAFIDETMRKAHEFQYNTYRALAQFKVQIQRYEKLVGQYESTYQMQNEMHEENRAKLIKQKEYNTQKTISDIKTQLSKVPYSGRDQVHEKSDWDDYQECKLWWNYEKQNQGRIDYNRKPIYRTK
ncbi:hypothetical protein C4G84_RS19480 [Vibrio parahaemolyticus O5:K30]|nr:hypothetical protein [Vibrio parahaemolyticus O5:K30]